MPGPGTAERWKHLILVVDDDGEHRRDVCEFLQQEGYRTLAAWNGREAFGLLLTSGVAPSLIILDLVMDSVDGREFRMRQLDHPRFSKVPVIVVSGMPKAEKVVESMGVRLISKPVNVDTLIDEVDRTILGTDNVDSKQPAPRASRTAAERTSG